MGSALVPPVDGRQALLDAAARLARAAGMRDLAHAACLRSRALLLDDHDRRLRMRAWMLRPVPVPTRDP